MSPEGPDSIELLLEPIAFPPSSAYQKALFDAGISLRSFAVWSIDAEQTRLENLGVKVHTKPTPMGSVTIAVIDETCGNLVQLVEQD